MYIINWVSIVVDMEMFSIVFRWTPRFWERAGVLIIQSPSSKRQFQFNNWFPTENKNKHDPLTKNNTNPYRTQNDSPENAVWYSLASLCTSLLGNPTPRSCSRLDKSMISHQSHPLPDFSTDSGGWKLFDLAVQWIGKTPSTKHTKLWVCYAAMPS